MSVRARLPLALLPIFLAVAWLYAWTPSSIPRPWTNREPVGFYPELTEGLLAGHLSLQRAPDPRLLALADPYDPAQNAPWRVNDLSLHGGHYYLYHGIAPALLLFAPVRLLTGRYLAESAAVLLFCMAGAGFSLLLVARIRHRYFGHSSTAVFGGCIAALLLSQGFEVVRTGPNDVAIAAAYCFLMASLLCLEAALEAGPRSLGWLALASGLYGCAVASRPNYIFGAAALLVPLIHRQLEGRRPQFTRMLVAAVGPLAAAVAGLLAYNQARFGNPLEFGTRYMLGGWDQRAYPLLNLHAVVANAGHYLVQPGIYHAEFPFLAPQSSLTIGVLPTVPFVWLAPLAGLTLAGAALAAGIRPQARAIAWAVLLVFLANFSLLLCLPSGNAAAASSANNRYPLDFLPALVLLSALGAMNADQALRDRPWIRRGFLAGAVVLAAISVLSAISLDFEPWPAETFRPLARILDLPTYAWQRLFHVAYGPISIELEFPSGREGDNEPVLATGSSDAGDLVYVRYESAESVRFGLVGVGAPGPLSPPVRIVPGQRHRLDISVGSLFPSVGHPLMAGLSEQQAAYLKRHVRLLIDGSVALDAPAYFHPASPSEIYVGATPYLQGYSSARFTGHILEYHRLSLMAPDSALLPQPVYGALLLKVLLPSGSGGSSAEPLVVTGVERAADFIYLRYRRNREIQFGCDHWGTASKVSGWLPVKFAVPHAIEISLGSLYPPGDQAPRPRLPGEAAADGHQEVRVQLDGKVVLQAEQPAYEASPYDVYVGQNPLGGSTCSYAFTGKIMEVERLPLSSR